MNYILSKSIIAVVLCTTLFLHVGCQHSLPSVDASHAPADFTLDYTQLAGDGQQTSQGAVGTSARYIVLADGTMHATVSSEKDIASLPPRVRTLSDAQLDQLWQLISDLDLNNPGNSTNIGNMQDITALPGQMTELLSITADKNATTVGRTRSLADEVDSQFDTLARTLAALAWLDGEVELNRTQSIDRYDFGDDPYQRYRK